jgi:hypothetical protein
MKTISILIALFFITTTVDITVVRQKYIAAAKTEADSDQLNNMLESVGDNSKEYTLVAYKAASVVLRAKYVKGLLVKKNLFAKGVGLLDATIAKDADNYEARLLRLNIQENAPRIAGYYKNIKEDKSFLIKHYNHQATDLKEFTKNFVKASESFSKEEKALFLK